MPKSNLNFKIIKWWQQQGVEQGVDTSDFTGNKLKYCGVIDYKFDYYDLLTVLQHKAKIIELPKELPEHGDRILVWLMKAITLLIVLLNKKVNLYIFVRKLILIS